MRNRLFRSAAALLAAAGATAVPAAAQPTAALMVVEREAPPLAAMPAVGPEETGWMAAHFINVGQGAATLLEFSCGLVLIDTGGGGAEWTARFTLYLDRVFARRPDLDRTIDLVVLTHPHLDHTRGAPSLREASRYRLRHIVTNAQPQGSGVAQQNQLTQFAAQNGVPVTPMRISMLDGSSGFTNDGVDPLRCNGNAPDIRLLWGSADQPPRWPATRDGNNHSVAVRVDFGLSSFLVTGDLEEAAQSFFIARYAANPDILDVDVYQVGHHGSRNGTTPELVRAMTPQLAVVGAGDPADQEAGFSAFNFGHPNREAIAMLSDPDHGVSLTRPIRRVAVGIRGRNPSTGAPAEFEEMDLGRGIFATGWDGDVVVLASLAGEKRVVID